MLRTMICESVAPVPSTTSAAASAMYSTTGNFNNR